MATKKPTATQKPLSVNLLVDADIYAFRAVSANYHQIEWEPDLWTYHVDMADAKAAFKQQVAHLIKHLEPSVIVLATTQAGGTNFRRTILDSYKGGRSKKPPGYREFQEWIAESAVKELSEQCKTEFIHYERETLEGDDVLGILATGAFDFLPGQKVISSIDKDLKSVPGLHWRLDENGKGVLSEVLLDDADMFHATQTLTGDTTDGYTGLPGIGPKKAEAILEGLKGNLPAMWKAVQDAYEKKGLTRDDMLVQARVARILRAGDYDFEKRQPILWSPPE